MLPEYLLHHVTYTSAKFEVATLGGDSFTRNLIEKGTHVHTRRWTEGRRTDFGTKLIYPFSKEKKGYMYHNREVHTAKIS